MCLRNYRPINKDCLDFLGVFKMLQVKLQSLIFDKTGEKKTAPLNYLNFSFEVQEFNLKVF